MRIITAFTLQNSGGLDKGTAATLTAAFWVASIKMGKPLSPKQRQLDWSSETNTLKINLLQDREGYNGFEYADEKPLTRRIQWCVDPSSIFIFGGIFEQ